MRLSTFTLFSELEKNPLQSTATVCIPSARKKHVVVISAPMITWRKQREKVGSILLLWRENFKNLLLVLANFCASQEPLHNIFL